VSGSIFNIVRTKYRFFRGEPKSKNLFNEIAPRMLSIDRFIKFPGNKKKEESPWFACSALTGRGRTAQPYPRQYKGNHLLSEELVSILLSGGHLHENY
jgi:hypothetical protein